MWKIEEQHSRAWYFQRLKRHFSELVRLAVPATCMRIGLMLLAIVDTAMVGHYATKHLAWLNLANTGIMSFALVVGIGLMTGVLIYTANAYGQENYRECGRVWRRTIPYTLCVGVVMIAVIWPASFWLSLLGQNPQEAERAGRITQLLLLSVPGHLLFLNCSMFLEGIKRPSIGFYAMIIANIINVCANYALIYGHYGAPEMGAEGSAIATTIVRWSMAMTLMAYIWYAPSIRHTYFVREKTGQSWADWADQRQMGYASGVSMAAEVAAFSGLTIFAGWIGIVELAAQGVLYQLLGVPFVVAVAIGIASSVRTGISFSRGDKTDTILASVSGIILAFCVTGLIATVGTIWLHPILTLFTDDPHILDVFTPLSLLLLLCIIFDTGQATVSNILRGFKETWWPTTMQILSFMGVMMPTSYVLSIPLGMGFKGLVIGTLAGVIMSWILQILRFFWLLR